MVLEFRRDVESRARDVELKVICKEVITEIIHYDFTQLFHTHLLKYPV